MRAVRLPADVQARLGLGVQRVPAAPRQRCTPRGESEEDIQRACFAWVEWNEARLPALRWLTHVPNGGKRPKGEAGKLKALGVRKGVLDLKLFWPAGGYVGLAIEMKSAIGKLRPDQREWREHLLATGWRVEICRTLTEFTGVVEDYLAAA